MQDAAMTREEARGPPVDSVAAAAFDFAESAELFTRRNPAAQIAAGTSPADAGRALSRATYRNALAYRRFASGAEALRYAIEELPPGALAASVLVVNGDRHDPAAIRALYASADYPLPRAAAARNT